MKNVGRHRSLFRRRTVLTTRYSDCLLVEHDTLIYGQCHRVCIKYIYSKLAQNCSDRYSISSLFRVEGEKSRRRKVPSRVKMRSRCLPSRLPDPIRAIIDRVARAGRERHRRIIVASIVASYTYAGEASGFFVLSTEKKKRRRRRLDRA